MNKEIKAIRNLSRDDCINVLKYCKIANVSFSMDNLPYVRAVPFKMYLSNNGNVIIRILVYYDNEMVRASETSNITQISFSAQHDNEIRTVFLKGTVQKKQYFDYCVEGFIADISEDSIKGKAYNDNIEGYFNDDSYGIYRSYKM